MTYIQRFRLWRANRCVDILAERVRQAQRDHNRPAQEREQKKYADMQKRVLHIRQGL